MWANLQDADLTGSKMMQTIFVESNLQRAKVTGIDKAGAYQSMRSWKALLGLNRLDSMGRFKFYSKELYPSLYTGDELIALYCVSYQLIKFPKVY